MAITVDDIKALRSTGKLVPADFKMICTVLNVLSPQEKLLPNMDLFTARILEHAPKATPEQVATIQTNLGAQKWEEAKKLFETKATTPKATTPKVTVPKATPKAAATTAVTPASSPNVYVSDPASVAPGSQPEGLELRIHKLEKLADNIHDLLVSLHEKFNVMSAGLSSMDERVENINDAVADLHKVTAYTFKQQYDAPLQACLDAEDETFEYSAPQVAFARGALDSETEEPGAPKGEG